jgi:hypothetical protein
MSLCPGVIKSGWSSSIVQQNQPENGTTRKPTGLTESNYAPISLIELGWHG